MTSIYENLSKKSSDELKTYIVNMSDGYKQEAVETAIEILKERGENVDDLLRSAQVDICARCTLRQQSKEGLVCSLTGNKADFICTCPSYDCDEKAAQEQAQTKLANAEYGGMMHFYWFCLGVGAALTTIMAFVHFKPAELGWLLSLSDLVLSLGYAALCVYTIVAFTKRFSNAITLGKIQNFTLIAMNSLGLIFNITGIVESDWMNNSIRLVGSIVWAGIFLSYLYGDDVLKSIFPKESRHMLKYDKTIIWSVLGSVVALWIAGVVMVSIETASLPETELRSWVNQTNSSLTVDTTSESYCKDIEIKDNYVVVSYHYNFIKKSDAPDYVWNSQAIFVKERIFFTYSKASDKLITNAYAAGYGISLNWYDSDDNFIYSVDCTPADVKKIMEDDSHSTSNKVWQNFLIEWNKQCPGDYLGGQAIHLSASLENNAAVLNICLLGLENSDLPYITEDYLKSYLIENFDNLTDNFISLAMFNKFDICFVFTSEASSSWSQRVTFTSADYE